MIFNMLTAISRKGYIAGANDGIVTALGKPVSLKLWLLNTSTLAVERTTTSLANGHYIFMDLDLDKDYLVIARDYKKELEPYAWGYVKPADDLTIGEQLTLYSSWQT